jgi:transcriptional regulator with XRE-family HTH domain
MTQRKPAQRAGVSPRVISQIENGRSYPSIGRLFLIDSTLDSSFDELIRGSPINHSVLSHQWKMGASRDNEGGEPAAVEQGD